MSPSTGGAGRGAPPRLDLLPAPGFSAAVRGKGPVEVTAEDGLRAVAMGVAAEISAREHRVVAMAEVTGL